MRFKLYLVITLILFIATSASARQEVLSPQDVLGFRVGEDYKLADWEEIVSYFRSLDAASDRILVQELGKTTMDNPFILAIISSPYNVKNVEHYREIQQRLADPRGLSPQEADQLIAEGKTIVLITCSIHSTEIASSQMSMELAYRLASEESPQVKEILDNVIFLLVPSLNPDGTAIVVDWYRKTLGTPYEGTSPPYLYHKYVGHDNNRDWYMITQQETKLAVGKIHNVWHPQIVYDMHQMGSRGARLFVPPFIDPIDPNVDPILQAEIVWMGSAMATELTAQGKSGVIMASGYDAWTPARAYQHYHGGIRILSEAASVRIASPIKVSWDQLEEEREYSAKESSWNFPLPWKGGEWHLRDIVDYELTAAFACLTHAARYRDRWLTNFYTIGKRALERKEPPFAFLVPLEQDDLPTAIAMLQVLRKGMVEIYRATQPFTADRVPYPAGTYVIPLAQPYGSYAKTLLEVQHYPVRYQYPGGPPIPPYDTTAHTLPLLMGVKTITVESPFTAELDMVEEIFPPQGKVIGGTAKYAYLLSHKLNNSILAVNRLLKEGYQVYWSADDVTLDRQFFPAGTVVIPKADGLENRIKSLASNISLDFFAVNKSLPSRGYLLKTPRIGLYKSWMASANEGWTRWVLEQWEFPYQSLYDKELREGKLTEKFDVIILPDQRPSAIIDGIPPGRYPAEYCGGIGKAGLENLKQWVYSGGTLITLGSASQLPIEQFWLPVKDSLEGVPRDKFSAPGAIVKVVMDRLHPIAYGYDREANVMFWQGLAFELSGGTAVATYPAVNPLLSGWIMGTEYLLNKGALVDIPLGKGRIILFGFRMPYRAQSYATFKLLFNALYYGTATLSTLP